MLKMNFHIQSIPTHTIILIRNNAAVDMMQLNF